MVNIRKVIMKWIMKWIIKCNEIYHKNAIQIISVEDAGLPIILTLYKALVQRNIVHQSLEAIFKEGMI